MGTDHLSSIVARSGEVVAAPMGEETAMMNIQTGSYYVLDDIAAFVWEALREPRSVADLLVEVRAAYDVSAETSERDVTALLDRMRAQGLVTSA